MKTKMNCVCFLPVKKAENNINNLLNNIKEQIEIFNEKFEEIDKKNKVYQIVFSTNAFSKKRIDVHIKIEMWKKEKVELLENVKISFKTPFSYGYSFHRKKIKKMFRLALKETLIYY